MTVAVEVANQTVAVDIAPDNYSVEFATQSIEVTIGEHTVVRTGSGDGGVSGIASVSTDATITGDGTSGSPLAVANPFTDSDETKLDGIDTSLLLPSFPASGDRDNKVAKFDGDNLNWEADATVSSATIADGSITESKLADGSVTDAKLADSIPRYRSAWSAGTYIVGDVVLHDSNFYQCLTARDSSHTDNPSADATNWLRLTTGALAAIATSAELTAGTETGIRRFSPADIHSMIDTHGSTGGGGTGNADTWAQTSNTDAIPYTKLTNAAYYTVYETDRGTIADAEIDGTATLAGETVNNDTAELAPTAGLTANKYAAAVSSGAVSRTIKGEISVDALTNLTITSVSIGLTYDDGDGNVTAGSLTAVSGVAILDTYGSYELSIPAEAHTIWLAIQVQGTAAAAAAWSATIGVGNYALEYRGTDGADARRGVYNLAHNPVWYFWMHGQTSRKPDRSTFPYTQNAAPLSPSRLRLRWASADANEKLNGAWPTTHWWSDESERLLMDFAENLQTPNSALPARSTSLVAFKPPAGTYDIDCRCEINDDALGFVGMFLMRVQSGMDDTVVSEAANYQTQFGYAEISDATDYYALEISARDVVIDGTSNGFYVATINNVRSIATANRRGWLRIERVG